MRRLQIAGGVVMLPRFLTICLLFLVGVTTALPQAATDSEAAKLAKCRSEARDLIKPDKSDITFLRQISDYCQAQVRGEDVLEDFNIRKSKYLQQETEGTILLWMVVGLTLSGVVMAALQLFAAYRLSQVGRGELAAASEILLERSKVSLKSSVTGLLILIVSFAFFIVYIIWVFTIKETRIDVEPASSAAPATSPRPITLSVGGLGSPPKN
jgi:hypothetical protein